MSEHYSSHLDGFNKTYQNTALRVGIIVKSYPIDDSSNLNKMVPEYDVMAFEKDENRGSAISTYKHCIAAKSLGSIADFFEMSYRKMEKNTTKSDIPTTSGQNGSIVLLLCLNGISDNGIIIGALDHPDRKTTLQDGNPYLQGEYNGVNIKVENDGSTSLTFRGATDNDGKIIDSSQGPTVMKIEKDGSYQVNHKTVTQRFDKKGTVDLTADDNISNVTKKGFNITASENIAMKATKNISLDCKDLLTSASGNATLNCSKLQISADTEISVKGAQFKVEAQAMANIKATTITLEGMVALGGAGGQPLLMMNAQLLGIGNLGAPVISTVISGFTIKTTAQ
jgi:phage gp45-like